MKYEIKPIDEENNGCFRQFDVTLRIESYDEYVCFHDQVAIKLADSSKFVGDIYAAGHGCGENKSGDVPLRSAGQSVTAQFVTDANGGYINFNDQVWRPE